MMGFGHFLRKFSRLIKMLTNEFESGNINKLSQDGKNHENFIVWKFSQIN